MLPHDENRVVASRLSVRPESAPGGWAAIPPKECDPWVASRLEPSNFVLGVCLRFGVSNFGRPRLDPSCRCSTQQAQRRPARTAEFHVRANASRLCGMPGTQRRPRWAAAASRPGTAVGAKPVSHVPALKGQHQAQGDQISYAREESALCPEDFHASQERLRPTLF